jgi:hypothetical protein
LAKQQRIQTMLLSLDVACAENLQLSQGPQIVWQLSSSCSESALAALASHPSATAP